MNLNCFEITFHARLESDAVESQETATSQGQDSDRANRAFLS
jgi:hypothetical protein